MSQREEPQCRPEQATKRRKNGTFAKGSSGNPGGKPAFVREIRARLEAGAEEVTSAVMEAARGGDMQACRLILERIVPAVKPVAEPVQFPLDDSDLPACARSILAAIAAGTLPPDQGKALIDSVVSMARVVEVAQLEQQLVELRELLEARQ